MFLILNQSFRGPRTVRRIRPLRDDALMVSVDDRFERRFAVRLDVLDDLDAGDAVEDFDAVTLGAPLAGVVEGLALQVRAGRTLSDKSFGLSPVLRRAKVDFDVRRPDVLPGVAAGVAPIRTPADRRRRRRACATRG